MHDTADILISGGGVAGLAAAAAFGTAGWSVLCVDPAPPVTAADAPGADLRTTAFLQPSIPVLEAAGLWPRLERHAMPLQVMRIVDVGGPEPVARVVHDFNASDVSSRPFGWNLPNWLLRREFLARLGELPNVRFRPGVATTRLLTRESEARVTLSDGSRVCARLLVAADGRASPMRQALGIGVKTLRYGQKALAFAVTHPQPHDNVSTEVHRTGGPFTLVPLPDHAGQPCSAVVWMDTGAKIAQLQALPVEDFEAAMNTRSAGLFGHLKLASSLTVWPIIAQIADRFSGERTALMAEAAHVVPPIGAQGLNMSIADLGALLDLARDDTLGSSTMLDSYHRRRWTEVRIRLQGIDLLNRASMLQTQPLRDLRAATLNALYALTPVRRGLMQMGIGMR
ncbi:MAG: UbiH/UbiF family hydroxylase [Pararhodobacter sp.]|nr:UbiH/UbiF family hydroxylase [Pararhodobacter sp.]